MDGGWIVSWGKSLHLEVDEMNTEELVGEHHTEVTTEKLQELRQEQEEEREEEENQLSSLDNGDSTKKGAIPTSEQKNILQQWGELQDEVNK